MLEYEPFRKKFIDAFSLVDGSVFESNRTAEIVYEMRDKAYNAMSFDGLSWDLSNSASSLINDIENGHYDRMNNLRSYFGLSSPYSIQMNSNVEGAILRVNGQEVPTGQFNGQLFAPATITAQAPAGYRFKGWQLLNVGASLTDAQTLFGINDSWNYYDQGSLDYEDWKDLSYSTSYWSTGYGPFGYGNVGIDGYADYQTTLDYGDDSGNKRPTYYLRKTFTIDHEPTEADVYQLTYYVDDGFVAYVNGVEIGRYLLNGSPYYDTYTTTYVSATAATATLTIDNSLLHQGENVIAVEVHNTSATSSDIYWAASLVHGTLSSGSSEMREGDLDLTTLDSKSAVLMAVFEQLPDDQLLADIATPVKVNEVCAANSIFVNDAFKKNDWLELYNMTDTDINAAGLYISDDVEDPLKYQIPANSVANTIIPAHGHLIVWADKLKATTQLHAPFKLGNANGQMVLITSSDEFAAANASFMAAHPALRDFADGLAYDEHRGDQTVGRYPDGGNTFYLMGRPTIEKQNTLCSFDTQTGVDKGIMNVASTFSLDLAQGWNWVSHPIASGLSVNLFKDHANRILGQTLEAYYSNQTGAMAGGLKTLTAGALYKFEMEEAGSYLLEGDIPSKTTPTSLRAGWNWIGYSTTGAQTLAAALAGSRLDDGDMIVGQNGFSVYNATDGWVGTLSSLTPGTGYLYRSATTKSIRFNPATTTVQLRLPRAAKA